MADPNVNEIKRVVSATVRDSMGGLSRDIQRRAHSPEVSKSLSEIKASLANLENKMDAISARLQEIDLDLYADHSLAERINLLTQSIRFQNQALDAMSKRLDRITDSLVKEHEEIVINR